MKGFMIAGVSSGVGKTTISMGLMSLFENVSPFKVGPDYIDGGFHQFATGNKSYNLDIFMMGEEGVKYSFFSHHKDISIIEGVMGLYDGIEHTLDNFSAGHLARILKVPVILVIDGKGKSTTIATQVLGCKLFDERVNIVGVIVNRVSEAMYYHCKEAIEKYSGIECVGYLPIDEELNIGSRHLGLLQADEIENLERKREKLKNIMRKTINIGRILELCDMEYQEYKFPFFELKNRYKGKKIAIARDKAFSFYYNDNIEFLEYMGLEIKYFSPLNDKKIPIADILYFGGGYPEIYVEQLSKNLEMIENIRKYTGKIFAECGGFIYLSTGLKTDRFYPLCDIFKCKIEMKERLNISRFGYVNLEKNNILYGKGHEFHYSDIYEVAEDKREFDIVKKNGRKWRCIFKKDSYVGGYPHIHFYGSIKFLQEFLLK